MKKSLYFFTFLLVLTTIALGQPALELKRLKAYYPSEGAVFIKNGEELNIEIVQQALSITATTHQEKMLLDTRAGLYSEYSLEYSDFSKISYIEASTLVPQKNSYKELKVKEFNTTDRLSKSSVFYDGSKNISFLFPSLTEGAKTSLKYVQAITQPQIIPAFYFQKHLPVLEATYTITVPAGIEIGWKTFNMPDSLISFTKVMNKNKVNYTWKAKNIKAFKDEEDAPNYLYSLGHMIIWIKSYNIKEKQETLLNSTQDLYKWYYSISKNCNNEHSLDLQNLVDSLTRDTKDETEKVKRIFYWVQDNIKYIAFEEGMGGFIPRSGKAVYEKRYGDCKDMASIITRMLSYAGIPSYLTWIGSRHIPYRYEDLPTPHVDNHMIATYISKENNYYFLDATGTYTPFGMPTSFIQGKQALIGLDSNRLEVKEVAAVPMEKNQVIDSVFINILGNKIVGKGIASFSGYNRIAMAERISNHRTEKLKIVKEAVNKGSNKFLIESFKVHELEDRDKSMKIDYVFNIEDYLKIDQEEIYVNLNLDRKFFIEEINGTRSLDIEKPHKEIQKSIIKLQIPNGYKVSYLPETASLKDEKFGFEIKYQQKDKEIILEQKVYYDFLVLGKKDFEQWNKYIKGLKKAYMEVLVLEKINKTQ